MANKNFDDVIKEIADDYQKVATQVLKSVAIKVRNDIEKEAYKYLRQYYNSYKPKMYKRTKKLKESIVPVFESELKNGILSFEVGVEYDPNKLKGYYKSNSKRHKSGDRWISRYDDGFKWDSGDNGIPEPEWILDNFLMGEHGGAQRDFNGTYTLMEYFFDNELPDRINDYMETKMIDIIMQKL